MVFSPSDPQDTRVWRKGGRDGESHVRSPLAAWGPHFLLTVSTVCPLEGRPPPAQEQGASAPELIQAQKQQKEVCSRYEVPASSELSSSRRKCVRGVTSQPQVLLCPCVGQGSWGNLLPFFPGPSSFANSLVPMVLILRFTFSPSRIQG